MTCVARSLWTIGALCALAGCAHPAGAVSEPQPGASEGDEVAPREAGGLDDGQIVHALDVIDADQMAQARVALRRANDPRVRELARRTLGAHEQAKLNTVELSRALATLPQASSLSRQLETGAAERLRLLESSATARVDTTYLQTEIERQGQLLSIVRDELLPAVRDTSLAKRLGAERQMLQDQRAAAQSLYAVLAQVTQPAQSLP